MHACVHAGHVSWHLRVERLREDVLVVDRSQAALELGACLPYQGGVVLTTTTTAATATATTTATTPTTRRRSLPSSWRTHLLEVILRQLGARSPLEGGASVCERPALEAIGAERLRETAGRLSDGALEVFDDGGGQRQALGVVDDLLRGETLRDDELGEIADNLGGGRHLPTVGGEDEGG